MRVLLLGEFSSLHRYLKEGLLELGNIDVKLFANGDGWKQIGGADGPLFQNNFNTRLGELYNLTVDSFVRASAFQDYDVVQIVNTRIYSNIVNEPILRMIAANNHSLSLVAAGEDTALINAYQKGLFDYYIYDYDKQSLGQYTENTLRKRILIHAENKAIDQADIIIPSLYEYTLGYKNNTKLHHVVPFPINLSKLTYQENSPVDKIVFFHGLNREASKGTPLIRAALERLKEKYPNDVDVIIDGHMPFEQYSAIMSRANVVIDQCLSYGYGINACLAMAQGKVVMSGARQETLDAFGVKESPIIHAKPDVDYLYQKLEYIVENKKCLSEWGYNSRQYVEKLHDHVKVAQQYVDAWMTTGKI